MWAAGPVTYERLLKAGDEPGNWLMYSGNYGSHRYSRLDQITPENVTRLHMKWVYQMQTTHHVETTPLVVDGIMYATGPVNDVVALDTQTGRTLWPYHYPVPEKVYTCCGQVNRGLAILGDRLFMATVDAKVIALDAKSGRLLWKTAQADYETGYAGTAAPIIAKDKVIVGSRAPSTESVALWMRTTLRLASGHGGSTRFQSWAILTLEPGKASRGRPAAARRGRPARMIRTSTLRIGDRQSRP